MYEFLLVAFIGVVVFAYGIDFILDQFDDPREPRRIRPKIPVPVIGHILGVLRYGFHYYELLSQNTEAEIFALGILNFKVYITRGSRIRQLVQKSKALSFTPFLKIPANVIGSEAHALFDGALLESFSHRTKEALTPGPHLDVQNLRMGQQILLHVTEMVQEDHVDLFEWAKHSIVQATAAGLYGAHHPFRDCRVQNALWTWEEYRPNHMLGTDFLRTGYKARDIVFEAFREYFRRIPDDASLLVQQRQKVMRDGGIAEEDTYKIQATLSNAAYPNTVPTLFWTIFEIYSRPQLLGDIRQELRDNAVIRSTEKGADEFVLDLAALQTACPVLLSTYQETQRTRHAQVAWRMVTDDTLLDGHMLKKGNYLQIPVRPTHEDPRIWGPRAAAFDPYRFVPVRDGLEPTKPKTAPPSAFMPWGSPPHLCPARQFASAEILIAAALLVLRVQLAPVGGRGWEQPALRSGTPALPRPKRDIRAQVTPTEDGRGNWTVVIGRTKARISLASG
ncbi:cytochrome P450 [Apiospora arundinis]|uniref:Cytochrome P450 n=1 Tax=Apiospora arundinis TaxID=335852 RepID=A0ABR2IS70_9PEZI